MTTPNSAQLASIADLIFVMGDRTTTRLPKPVATAAGAFSRALDPIAAAHDFKDAGLAVIDYTRSASAPDIWLHNAATPYRVGSASKIAVMLAAVQLRLEVRKILDLKIVTTPAEFDALYANRKLWAKAKAPVSELLPIAANPPLISQIFDFGKSPVDFAGPDPDGQSVAANQKKIMDKLPGGHLRWANWSALSFAERYWLCGCKSDNVAAATCVSQIGVPYIKAVQRAYGLADTARGMHLLASSSFDTIPRSAKPPAVAPPRPIVGIEPLAVTDAFVDGRGGFTDKRSVVPGSAAALAAYMMGMVGNTLVNDGSVNFGQTGCTTLRNNLADGGTHAIESFLASGVKAVGGTVITKQVNKIGILTKADGAKAQIICEFVYLETQEVPKPASPRREFMKYAVVAVGIISELDATPPGHSSSNKAGRLGGAVHLALRNL